MAAAGKPYVFLTIIYTHTHKRLSFKIAMLSIADPVSIPIG